MKKVVAMLLALALAVTGIAAAMADYDMVASMKKWVDVDLDGYRVVQLFNYNESIAVNVGGFKMINGLYYDSVVPTGGANTVIWDHVKEYKPDPIDGGINGDDMDIPFDPTVGMNTFSGGLLPDHNVDFGDTGWDSSPIGVADGEGPAWNFDHPNYPGNWIPEYYAVGEATRWIDNSVAKAETNPTGKTTPRDAAKDVRYVISGTYVAGFEAGKEILNNGSTKNVVPVDLTVEENTVFVYPIATNSHVVIGLLFAKVNVEEGFVQIAPTEEGVTGLVQELIADRTL